MSRSNANKSNNFAVMVDMKHIEFLENRVVISVDNNNNNRYLKVMEILLNDEN